MRNPLTSCGASTIAWLRDRIHRWTRPSTRPILGYVLDRFRSPEDLVREHALLRKQLEIACHQIARPRLTWVDRGMLVLLRLWGAERIRGELLKLGIRLAKRTIQKYMRRVAGPRPPGQRWATFLRNHAHETWACDFLQTYDLLFRPIFTFFLIELGSRRIMHAGVTRAPSSAWGDPAAPRGHGVG